MHNYLQGSTVFINNYYMANPVLGKSLCSDWFFLGQDFAVRTGKRSNPCIFALEQSRQIQNLQPKQRKKNCELLSSFTAKLPEKAKKIEIFPKFQRWMKKTNILQARFIILKISGNFWCRKRNRHHWKPGDHRRFYQPTENYKHKQEDGYWYEHSSPLHGS